MNFKQFRRNNDVRIRKMGNSYYVISLNGNYEINETGVIVLKYIGQDISFDDFYIRIADKYNYTDIQKISNDIKNYIDYMIQEKIIYETLEK